MRIRQAGMSLVEVMVAVLIGMIGILIITQAYLTGERFNRSTLGEGGAQTNGLIALHSIERDVRNSGYGIADSAALGCGELYWYRDPNFSKNVNAGSPLERVRLAPVFIETGRISVLYATDAERMLPASASTFNTGNGLLTLESRLGFAINDFLVMVGTSGCILAQVTNVPDPTNETNKNLELNPGYADRNNPTNWTTYPTSVAIGNLVLNLGANPVMRTYSIVNGKLRVTDPRLLANGIAGVDLLDGIVDLAAQYGKDNGVNNGTVGASVYVANDFIVDQFSATSPVNSAEWQQVLSVRVGVLARIGEYEKPDSSGVCQTTTVAPSWAGGAFAAISVASASADRCYRYRVFETTIPLRNMIWRPS